jgi:DNA-binding NtrC family response regulator
VSDERLELAVFSAKGLVTHALTAGKRLVVGRAEEADIVIDDDAVSRRHAIFHGGPPAEIEDLGSSNGTFISPSGPRSSEGQTADQRRIRVTRRALEPGDSVFFGAALVTVRRARAAPNPNPDAVVQDPALVRVYEEAARAAAMSLPILILGETGVGKDVLARFIHKCSSRAQKPFLALNCAALSESLAESELFGHEKGAFTGAQQARAGVFEAANGGTIFLDEIGDLPLATQAKLLRTLESSELQRVGSTKTIKVDVRFISATHRDLERASAEGRFRQDLYFRVNGISFVVPPLRARPSEIAPLAQRFLETASRTANLPVPDLSPDALRALEAYTWPGNVRELRFAMERALVGASGGTVLREHLPPQIQSGSLPLASSGQDPASRERVIEALARCDGNQTKAADLLGISRRTLINRMVEYDLPRPRKG